MLILSRKRDEEIIISPGEPGEIRIMVVDIRGDVVRIGVDAPDDVTVHRREIAEQIERQRRRP